jgi:hypothetical protein
VLHTKERMSTLPKGKARLRASFSATCKKMNPLCKIPVISRLCLMKALAHLRVAWTL